jgi:tetratricopeptide (TPR) repeat protein
LGIVLWLQGDYPGAQEHYQLAMTTYRAEGHRQREADILTNLGTTYYETGDHPTARDYYERALSIYRTVGDRWAETMALNNLGMVYCDLGDFEASREHHQQALDIRITLGDRWGEANSRVNLALVLLGLGDDDSARQHCQGALTIQREIGDRRGEGYSLTYLGHALIGLGELEAAAEAYEEAIQLRRELGQYSLLIDGWAGLAQIAMAQGHSDQALERAEDILAWIEANGTKGIEYPLQVYLTCFQILQATMDEDPEAAERANAVLSEAHTALMKQASSIRDETLRLKFLENVKANREIVTAWQRREPPS